MRDILRCQQNLLAARDENGRHAGAAAPRRKVRGACAVGDLERGNELRQGDQQEVEVEKVAELLIEDLRRDTDGAVKIGASVPRAPCGSIMCNLGSI